MYMCMCVYILFNIDIANDLQHEIGTEWDGSGHSVINPCPGTDREEPVHIIHDDESRPPPPPSPPPTPLQPHDNIESSPVWDYLRNK